MKQNLVNLAKLLITLALIVFILTRVDLSQVGTIIVEANPWLLLLALALYFAALVVGAFKWQILVRAQGIDASLGDLLASSLMGLFFGNVMPTNIGGDVVRAYDLARATRGRSEAAAISVLVDRMMGLFSWFSAAVVTSAITSLLLTEAQRLEQLEIATIIVASGFLALCAMLFSRRIARRAAVLFQWSPLARVKPIAENIYHALQVYRFRYGALALNVLLSLGIVVITAFVWFLVGQAVGITHVNFFYFLLFNPLVGFVLLVPISINGLGAKEAAVVFFFGMIGVANERALAMSLLFHLIVVLTSLPGGLVWLRARRSIDERPWTKDEGQDRKGGPYSLTEIRLDAAPNGSQAKAQDPLSSFVLRPDASARKTAEESFLGIRRADASPSSVGNVDPESR